MGPIQAAKNCVTQYAVFEGRACRSEFWWWQLLIFGVGGLGAWHQLFMVPLLAMLVPTAAVTVRRLHDLNRSEWWLMLIVIPILGSMILLIMFLFPGTKEGNQYDRVRLDADDRVTRADFLKLAADTSNTVAVPGDDRGATPGGNTADSVLKPGDIIFLVHGTFASTAKWIEDNAVFAETLRARVPGLKIESFRWSGFNSPTARMQAGEELVRRGEELYLQGYHRFWIVGHSHGGNVALYSQKSPIMRIATKGICFLGTPFLESRRRPVEHFSSAVTQTVSWLILFPGWMPTGAMALMNLLSFNAFFAGSMLFFGNGVIALAYIIARPKLRRYAHRKLTGFLQALQDRTFKRLSVPEPSCPSFIAYVNWDEAGMLLRAWDKIALAPWVAFGFVARYLAIVIVATIASFFLPMALYGDTVIELFHPGVFMTIGVLLPLITVVAPLIIAPLVAILRGNRLAFGYEGIVGAATLHIEPNSLPKSWRLTRPDRLLAMTPPTLRGLRHSFFYENPAVINACSNWMCGKSKVAGSEHLETLATRSGHSGGAKHWIVGAALASVIIGWTQFAIWQQVSESRIPKFDEEQTSTLFEVSDTNQNVFAIDKKLDGYDRGMFDISPAPFTLELDEQIAAKTSCVVHGKLDFTNWETAVALSVHEGSGEVGSDREVWSWSTSHGLSVTFRRLFNNPLTKPVKLRLKFWNKSRDPAPVHGTLAFACDRS